MWNFKTPGIPDEMFSQIEGIPGPTKEEIRVVTISKARLKEGNIVIDVGCGTGGITVEAALQVAPTGKVFAVDENLEAIKLTQKNVDHFGLKKQVHLLHRTAAEAFLDLPEADAVIVGGSHSLRETIQNAFRKLKANGRIVINAILLETATTAIDEMKKIGFKDLDVIQLFVAKGKGITSGTMMVARNPITIISATKE